MTILDYSIVLVYLAGMVFIGLYFQRKASAGIDEYFLAGKKLKWWMLGTSGMASNLDVSGTMINTAMIYSLGAIGFYVEIRGGIVLILAFLMIFMGKWNRRANVMTLAEWMELRFGKGTEGKIARIIAAAAILFSSVAVVTYFAVGSGKFIGEFLGLPALLGFPPEFWASTLMIILAMIYTVASGLYGVVWTDAFQAVLILVTIVIICYISVTQFILPENFSVSIPLRDGGFTEVQTTREEWTSIIPKWHLDLPQNSSYSVFNLFGIAIIFYLIKTIVEGSGGTGGYMIQRYFASRSDREAGLLSLFWTFLLSLRWPFIMAVVIMGISYGASGGSAIQDPEKVLPVVILKLVPAGITGLLVAGLMAAAMSTFDSIVNSAASYWVKDIYQAFINPGADNKQLIAHSRWASVIIVAAGLLMTLNIRSINEIWAWFNMGIGAGLIIPLVIRWYWWRLNGYGFAAGIASGMTAAIVQKLLMPDAPEYLQFSIVTMSSLTGTFAGTFLSKPTDNEVLLNFYKITRPFGFWGPVKKQISPVKIRQIGAENRRDIIAVCFAVPWQIVLFLTGMTAVMRRWDYLAVLTVILIILSLGLYHFWFKHLSAEVKIDNEESLAEKEMSIPGH